jgi:hypothetical protein
VVHEQSVDLEEMRSKLLTLDDVREKLATTEPFTAQVFEAPQAQIRLEHGWAEAEAEDDTTPVSAWLQITRTVSGEYDEIQLTKQTALEFGAFCGLPRERQKSAPADLVQTWVNGILRENLARSKDMKLLISPGTNLGTALTRSTIQPFSNLQFLDIMLEGIQAAYGEGEVLADYKFHHDLERTNLRLIVPGAQRLISGTRVADDTWSAGIQLRNSLTGIEQTAIDGYLFRWWCTNGCTDTLAEAGALNRRQTPSPEDAYEWARESVNEILGGLEGSFAAVQSTTGVAVEPDQVAGVVRDLFTEHAIPARSRERIVAELADTGEDMTVYDVMQAVTVGANAPGTSPDAIEQMLRLGGHIAHVTSNDRCGECRRILPGGFSAN